MHLKSARMHKELFKKKRQKQNIYNGEKNSNTFKDFSSNLAADLVKECYSAQNVPSDSFKLKLTNKEEVIKILSNAKPDENHDGSLDEVAGRMLKDGAEILA